MMASIEEASEICGEYEIYYDNGVKGIMTVRLHQVCRDTNTSLVRVCGLDNESGRKIWDLPMSVREFKKDYQHHRKAKKISDMPFQIISKNSQFDVIGWLEY